MRAPERVCGMGMSEAKSLRIDTDGRGGEVLPFMCVSPFDRAAVRVRRRFCVLLLVSAAVCVHYCSCATPFVCRYS